MTHHRHRGAEPLLKKMLSYSPCVGVLGMRQVGKSTLLRKFSRRYHSFDDEEFLVRFASASKTYLDENAYPLALDEIQKHPPAFDALKFSIDSLKKPGRFLVSGSVRFAARKQIRESLTGRIALLEIMPLTLAECHSTKASHFLSLLQKHADATLTRKLRTTAWADETKVAHYAQIGGLPGICFRRETAIREQMLSTHVDTLLGRDIHMIVNTKLSVKKLRDILTAVAHEQGLPVSYSKLARLASVSVPTVQNLLAALEGLFLIRPYGKTYYVEDAGLSHFLSPAYGDLDRRGMIRCLHYELKTQFELNMKHQAQLQPYVTRGGIDLPFLLSFKNGERIAIGVESDDKPSDKSVKSLVWFKKRHPRARLILLTRGTVPMTLTSGILCLPWTWAF